MSAPGFRVLAGMVVVAMLAPLIVFVLSTGAGAAELAPALSGKRLGLHVSAGELATWRRRARRGPYKSSGDVSTNSPGDWARIVSEKNEFMGNPSAVRWAGPAGFRGIDSSGCVERGSAGGDAPFLKRADLVNGAAFYALVKRNATVARKVARQLGAQVNHRDTKFGVRSRYCLNAGMVGDQVPGFMMGDWIAKWLYAYDYTRAYERENGVTLLGAKKKAEIREWFTDVAVWFAHRNHAKVKKNFRGRVLGNFAASDYSTTRSAARLAIAPLWDGGPVPRRSAFHFNNRNARVMRAVGLVGVLARNRRLIDMAKQFYKEVLVFTVFPQGAMSDFHRGPKEPSDSGKGWKYSMVVVSGWIMVADALSRRGDDQLYDFATTRGAHGTQGRHWTGGRKTLEKLLVDMGRYVSGDFRRRAGGDLIGPNADGIRRVHDVALAPANRYYRNSFLRDVYRRRVGPGYPARPNGGKFVPWRGDTGSVPGVLFMFGGTEG
ncbi:MAG: hypothetical protein M3O70_00960 [Actinomycetota bacterium]|nr:hypothetical protein [Actinomycetota bacterium]